jgi:predicted enzyme related to lactoylglutathione lyase
VHWRCEKVSGGRVEEEQNESRVFRSNGISFLSIPSIDHAKSARFYEAVFGWKVKVEPNHASFEDGTGHVIGHLESEFSVGGLSLVVASVLPSL